MFRKALGSTGVAPAELALDMPHGAERNMTHRWLALPVTLLALCVGCGGSSGGPRTGEGGDGGGGAGGQPWIPACQTGALCARCPEDDVVCGSDTDCSIGFNCIESGCATNESVPIKTCALAPAGFCITDAECGPDRVCTDLGDEGFRCVKTTPGCDSGFDCVTGFSCEGGACVDRRVPCFLDDDCPKSLICEAVGLSNFCQRVHQTCVGELDCAGIAPRCEDIDGDGRSECAGSPEPNAPSPVACLNSDCTAPDAPVCEVSQASSTSVCGQYGLCLDDGDCVDGFECVGLWPDGRKECVPAGGSCSHITDCPVRQVCASPRTGGVPSCQGGVL